MNRSLALLAAMSLALGANVANADRGSSDAESSETQKPEMFKELDSNKDGKINKTEAKANSELSKEFSKLDSNKNGSLDEGEFARFEAEDSSKEWPKGSMEQRQQQPEQPMEPGR